MARVIFWACFVVLLGVLVALLGAAERRRRDVADEEARRRREIDQMYVQPQIREGWEGWRR